MNPSEQRGSSLEIARSQNLVAMLPPGGEAALDVGARDGYFSRILADRFRRVVAVHLIRPEIDDPRIECLQADAAALPHVDREFDFVLCAEVLEHVPPQLLPRICMELKRVCSATLVIGVPFRQDIRIGRLTCSACGGISPPYGHVNTFDMPRLVSLFSGFSVADVSFVGSNRGHTSALAVRLMDFAGNPYAEYTQLEHCPHCDRPFTGPLDRSLLQKLATRIALWAQALSSALRGPRPMWMHVRFVSPGADHTATA